MSIKRLSSHPSSRKYLPHIFLIVACFLAFLFMIEPPITHEAYAALPTPKDKDMDMLPDAFEFILGTNYLRADSDEDGIPDGVEFVMHSDPLNNKALPSMEPGMRQAIYEEADYLKICFFFFPGDVQYLNKFNFIIAFDDSLEGDSTVHPQQMDATGLIPYVLSASASTEFNGVKLTTYEIFFPKTFLKRYSPLSFGSAANYTFDTNTSFVDITDVDFIENVPVKLCTLGLGINMDICEKYYVPLTADTPATWTNDQICKTTLTEIATNEGVTTYEVTDAACASMLDQNCTAGGCSGQVGDSVISIDPSFLSSTLDQ